MSILYPVTYRNPRLLGLIFLVTMMGRQFQVARGVSPLTRDDQSPLTADDSVALMPSAKKTMKRPCVLYFIEYLKMNGSTNELDNIDDDAWVCELDAEDRVSVICLS